MHLSSSFHRDIVETRERLHLVTEYGDSLVSSSVLRRAATAWLPLLAVKRYRQLVNLEEKQARRRPHCLPRRAVDQQLPLTPNVVIAEPTCLTDRTVRASSLRTGQSASLGRRACAWPKLASVV